MSIKWTARPERLTQIPPKKSVSNWRWVGLALEENLDVTRLTLSTPWGCRRKTFKALPVHSATEGGTASISLCEECQAREEAEHERWGGVITQGGFPTWLLWICHWCFITLHACCEFAIEESSCWLCTEAAGPEVWLTPHRSPAE